jgi:hypothetical protein
MKTYNNFLTEQDKDYIQSIIKSPRWFWGCSSRVNSIDKFWRIDKLHFDTFFNPYLLDKIKELTGDETGASIGDQKEGELKRVGINLKTFKAKKFI